MKTLARLAAAAMAVVLVAAGCGTDPLAPDSKPMFAIGGMDGGMCRTVSHAPSHERPGLYILDPMATITYVSPTSSAPVTVLDSEPLRGCFQIERQLVSPFFGGELFRVTAMRLITRSGKSLELASVDPSEDPILASTGGVPASFVVAFSSSGTVAPGVVLEGDGIEPGVGFQGFSIQQTGLMRDGTFRGEPAAPAVFDFTTPQPFTPPGVGLYEYAVRCDGEDMRCSAQLRLFAVLNLRACAAGPARSARAWRGPHASCARPRAGSAS